MPNILLHTCPLDIHSGGICVIYLFFDLCKKNGINIYLCPLLCNIDSLNWRTPFHNKRLEEIRQEEVNNYFRGTPREYIVSVETLRARDNVILYAEDIIGNPAEQKYVVRWLLFFPIPQAVQSYSFEKDYICFFSDYIFNLYDNLCKNLSIENHLTNKINKPNILRIFNFKNNFFKDKNYKREGGVFMNRKGYPPYTFRKTFPSDSYDQQIMTTNKNISDMGYYELKNHGLTHEEMIEVFNSKETFVSVDPFTFTFVIASLCGCNSVVNKIPNLSYDEWKNSDPLLYKYGIAYGIENIEEASKTRHLLEEHIHSMFLENESNLMNFIKDIELFFNIQVK